MKPLYLGMAAALLALCVDVQPASAQSFYYARPARTVVVSPYYGGYYARPVYAPIYTYPSFGYPGYYGGFNNFYYPRSGFSVGVSFGRPVYYGGFYPRGGFYYGGNRGFRRW